MFSVHEHTADITYKQSEEIREFFEDLFWAADSYNPEVSEIDIGDIMRIIDFKERWVYKGSFTTPPC